MPSDVHSTPTHQPPHQAPQPPAPEAREIDLTLPLAIIIAGLIVGGAVIYGSRTVSGDLQAMLAKGGSTVATGTGTPAPSQPAAQPAQNAPNPNERVQVASGVYPALGKEDAKVTIVEFSDFECPFCKRYHDDAFSQIKKEYVDTGKVKVYVRHYPLPFHPQAPKAGEAVACANDQGKFWDMADAIFADQANIKVDDLKKKAKALGMNASTFNSCLDSGQKKTQMDKDTADGNAAGVNGTPTMFVNGKRVVGAVPFSQFKTIIDQELAA